MAGIDTIFFFFVNIVFLLPWLFRNLLNIKLFGKIPFALLYLNDTGYFVLCLAICFVIFEKKKYYNNLISLSLKSYRNELSNSSVRKSVKQLKIKKFVEKVHSS